MPRAVRRSRAAPPLGTYAAAQTSVESSRRSARSRSCTARRSSRRPDPSASRQATSGCRRLAQRLLRGRDERHLDAERLLGARDGLVVEERDDGLAERHRLDREDPVPAGVQLVDHDVGRAVALERLVVVESLDELEVGVQALRRAATTCSVPLRRRDEGACTISGRARSDGGAGSIRREVDPGRDHLRLRAPSGSRRTSRRSGPARACRTRARPATGRGCPSRGSGRPTSSGTPAAAGTEATSARASSPK